MLNGLYKVEIDGARGSGRGVMVVRDGHLFGGNAAFALAGRCLESGQELAVDITTVQRNDGLGFKPVAGVGRVALRGRREGGNRYLFEGGTALLAGAPFTVVMTAISEEAVAAGGRQWRRRHPERTLFASYSHARRHRFWQYRPHGAA
jgi:hypothetical protein